MSLTLHMTPATGERTLRYVGDRVRLSLRTSTGTIPKGWTAKIRTNLGRAAYLRKEIIQSNFKRLPIAGASWRDLPLTQGDGEWFIEMPLTEVGFFKAKAYALDENGKQVWPDGPDVGICVHPDSYRTANTIYCAFPRMFGPSKKAFHTIDEGWEGKLKELDQQGYTVIPPSGKLRDVIRELPHIMDGLGCRILHLLPVNSTPTTLARFGRFGSPYACQDLTDIITTNGHVSGAR